MSLHAQGELIERDFKEIIISNKYLLVLLQLSYLYHITYYINTPHI